MARIACEADLASDDGDRFAAAMLLCMDPTGSCASRGDCSYGDCFRHDATDFRKAERRMNRLIVEAEDKPVADWLRIGLAAMQKAYRDEVAR